MRLLATSAALLTASMLSGLASASSSSTPRLAVAAKNPLALRATGFRAAERVTIYAAAGGSSAHTTIRASSTGTFVVHFRALHAVGCATISARATGIRGSKAALKIVPDCAQPVTP